MKNKIFIISCFLVFAAGESFAQSTETVSKKGSTAANFLTIGMGARAQAMGSSYVAVAEDPTALYWNPAGIARARGFQFAFDHTEWIADLKYNFFAATYSSEDYGTIGFSFTSSDYGEIEVTTVDYQNGNGIFYSVKDGSVSLAYAINLTDNFSVGFNPKVIYQSIWNTSAYSLALDMGVLYNTPFEGFTLGMSISNYGSKMKLDGISLNTTKDPDEENSGNNSRITAKYETKPWEIPVLFRFGIKYDVIKNEDSRLILTADALHPNDDHESINLGTEYVFHDFLAIRAGYKSLMLVDSEESYSFGGGIKQLVAGNLNVSIDYAYSDFGRLKNAQKITIGIIL